jgi:ABC-type multidrug transport system fused ATPase/permease subunit
MQGFLTAMLFCEAAKRCLDAGKELTGRNLKAALNSIKDFDTGGLIGAPITIKPAIRSRSAASTRPTPPRRCMAGQGDWINVSKPELTMASAAPPILDVNNIEVVYNKTVQVLRGLSLRVPRGQIVALLGSNGAGKSTTLKAISRLLELEDGAVTGGAIRFDGAHRAAAPHALVRKGLFHVMEGRRIFEDLTVEENLTAATFALTGRRAPQKASTSSMTTSRACTSAARASPAISPAASSRCWRSAVR